MSSALIGYTGFVGSNLLASRKYDSLYNSSSILNIQNETFDHIVCAGVQAMKWWANLHPEEDKAGINRLLSPLSKVRSKRFTLISTIDIYPSPQEVDEDSSIDCSNHHTYGMHRLEVEEWIKNHFSNVLILRLPGLFGPGLKKNVIYDILHDNNLDKVHPEGVFQYYDLRCLADDIDKAWGLGISVLNISSTPLGTTEIRDQFFPHKNLGGTGPAPARYDMRSKHATAWNGNNGYLYSKDQILADLAGWFDQEQLKPER